MLQGFLRKERTMNQKKMIFSMLAVMAMLVTLPACNLSQVFQSNSAQIATAVEQTLQALPSPTVLAVTETLAATLTPSTTPVPTVAMTATPVQPAVGCIYKGIDPLSNTSVQLYIKCDNPNIQIVGVCTGDIPCDASAAITYTCQLTSPTSGSIYCKGLKADVGSDLTACITAVGGTQPICFTYPNFQRDLLPFASPTPAFAVTGAGVYMQHYGIDSTCPYTAEFRADIVTTGPGTVTYHWVYSNGTSSPTATLTYSAAGTQTVTSHWTMNASTNGSAAIYIDQPNHQQFAAASFTLNCTP
jgi:hypothetical protein